MPGTLLGALGRVAGQSARIWESRMWDLPRRRPVDQAGHMTKLHPEDEGDEAQDVS